MLMVSSANAGTISLNLILSSSLSSDRKELTEQRKGGKLKAAA